MTWTVADAALMMDVLCESDPRDCTLPASEGGFLEALDDGNLRGLRVAYSPTLGYVDIVTPQVRASLDAVVAVFTDLGVCVEQVDPGFADPLEAFNRIFYGGAANALRGVSAEQRAKMDEGLVEVAAWAEKLVGVVLIGMGLWGFYSLLRQRIHAHPHEHDGERHAHIHAHRRAADGSHNGAAHRRHSHAVAGIGLLHGVAGVGPFLAVMPAMVLAEPMVRNVYVMAYGLGAMFAMGLFAWVVGVVVCRAGGRSARVYNGMVAGSAGVALSVGTLWLLQ
jgi:hypothetical protein